jgi:hypothetical protein
MYIKDLIVTGDAHILGTLYTNGGGTVSGLPQITLSTFAAPATSTANSIWVQLL